MFYLAFCRFFRFGDALFRVWTENLCHSKLQKKCIIFFFYYIEGFLTTCTFDYMSDDASTKLFVGCIFFTSYIIPLSVLVYCYSSVIKHVRDHEQTLKNQAKKMNVTSLRSNANQNETSAEVRVCKVAITLASLFLLSWTPYAFVALTAAFGNRY